jgi:predicted CoA-binding protein
MSLEQDILKSSHTIAVVGLSANPERYSHRVASYLQDRGYQIIPVNPGETEVLGEACYTDLLSVPHQIDVVDIFRRAEDVPPVVRQAISIGAGVIWMQLGIVNEEAAALAREAGLKVVMDRCMMREHEKLKQGREA